MKPPIKYFGGKAHEAPRILESFPRDPEIYVEPFGGSAALLLAKPQSPIEIYNDLEENVYSLFLVLADPKLFREFKRFVDLTPFSEQIRDRFIRELRERKLTTVERGYRFFIVNRTSINGVGGFMLNTLVRRGISKSVSDYLSAVDRLQDIHERMSNVVVLKQDAFRLLKKFDLPEAFFYLDPPYHWSTRSGTRYTVDMPDDKQVQFIDVILKMKANVLLSGYDNPEYQRLVAAGWIKESFDVKVKGQPRTECLWRNYVPTVGPRKIARTATARG